MLKKCYEENKIWTEVNTGFIWDWVAKENINKEIAVEQTEKALGLINEKNAIRARAQAFQAEEQV